LNELMLVFLAGLAGSMHCVGMCGGFACALGGDARGPLSSLLRHALYNSGRLCSYCFLGALAAAGGTLLAGHGGEPGAVGVAQRLLALLSGGLMLVVGLRFLGVLRFAGAGASAGSEGPLVRWLKGVLRTPGFAMPLAFGVLNGLLPCPLVYAFAAQAAASGGPLEGVQIMVAFGLGTFPAMLAMGGLGWWWRQAPRVQPVHASFLPPVAALPRLEWRVLGVRIAGGFIVLLGAITLARGVLPMVPHALMGH
jgi:hypothetical protein